MSTSTTPTPPPLHPKLLLLISTVFLGDDVKTKIGNDAYSYFFVYRTFRPLMERYCQVRELVDPKTNLDAQVARARAEGLEPIHLAILPLQYVHVGTSCPTLAIPSWEFPDVPTREFHGDPRQNWVRVGNQLAGMIGACHSTRNALLKGGVTVPICVLPTPVKDVYFSIAPWVRGAARSITCDWRQLNFKPIKIEVTAPPPFPVDLVAEAEVGSKIKAVPRRAYAVARGVYHRARPLLPPVTGTLIHHVKQIARRRHRIPPPPPAPAHELDLSGVVFTSIFNPTDDRKNWQDMITAMLYALGDKPDATLVLKLVLSPAMAEAGVRIVADFYHSLRIEHQCKVALIPAYLTEQQMFDLTAATAFYVNASRSEGTCLPLQDFLSAGRPAVAVDNTSMADYFDSSCGLVVRSHPEPTHIPHDPEKAIATSWNRVDWASLRDGYAKAYDIAKSTDGTYEKLAASARARLQGYASNTAVWPRLIESLDTLVAAARAK